MIFPPQNPLAPLSPDERAECRAALDSLIAKGFVVRTAAGLHTTAAGAARLVPFLTRQAA